MLFEKKKNAADTALTRTNRNKLQHQQQKHKVIIKLQYWNAKEWPVHSQFLHIMLEVILVWNENIFCTLNYRHEDAAHQQFNEKP